MTISLTVDEERAVQPLTRRERLAIKIGLMLIGMVWPGKYKHQIDKVVESIEAELMR